ncbi:MAG: glycosyltransferase [Rickettsiales bacterium]|jgi:glycosyltransferase involved in cell wall biosynthesis|nr:glycosyltransferase [Rickettsiales bacterium]
MTNPKISVIVPAYNTAQYIAPCLDSILSQTFADFEVICIDDGSTDDSLDIFNRYAKRDNRIRVINQKNQGVVYARNNAIAAARGEYIFPLDSDDMIAPNCLEELYKTITTTDYAVVCCDGILFGRRSGKWRLPRVNRLNMYAGRNGVHNSSLYAKKSWEKYGGYCADLNSLSAEDYDFWLCFLDDRKKITRIRLPLFFYRIKPVEASRNHCGEEAAKKQRDILARRHTKIRFWRAFRSIFKPFLVFFR